MPDVRQLAGANSLHLVGSDQTTVVQLGQNTLYTASLVLKSFKVYL